MNHKTRSPDLNQSLSQCIASDQIASCESKFAPTFVECNKLLLWRVKVACSDRSETTQIGTEVRNFARGSLCQRFKLRKHEKKRVNIIVKSIRKVDLFRYEGLKLATFMIIRRMRYKLNYFDTKCLCEIN